jgi:hypothetical protein
MAFTEKRTDAWFRDLNDGRVEIMCRGGNYRLRVSAPADEAWEAVELFERWSGLQIESERRPPRRRLRMIVGQLSMYDLGVDGQRAEDED